MGYVGSLVGNIVFTQAYTSQVTEGGNELGPQVVGLVLQESVFHETWWKEH